MHPKGKRLLDRVAIVTGGARGIGKAIALRYTKEGAAVVIADRKAAEAVATVAEIEVHGGRAMFVHTDVTANASIENMVNETLRRYGRIDILVNNAGVALMREITAATEDDWDRLNGVNLKGLWLCTRAVVPTMIANRFGKIINMASMSGIIGYQWESIYAATKGGVISMTRELAVELCPFGINVNCICPGIIDTPIYLDIDFSLDDPENLESTLKSIPLKRIGKPDDVAGGAYFLASDDSSYLMGQALVIDGGYTLI